MISSSDMSSDFDSPLLTSSSRSRTSDGSSVFTTSSDGNYNSDQSSGHEENPDFVDEMRLL